MALPIQYNPNLGSRQQNVFNTQIPTLGNANFFNDYRSQAAAGALNQSGNGYAMGQQMMDTSGGFGNTAYAAPTTAGSGFLANWGAKAKDLFGGGADGTVGGMGATGWGAALQGIQGIGAAWLGRQQLKQSKKEFKFNKGMAERNLANSAQLINTNISRRAESNAASLGYQGAQADQYVAAREKKESVRGTI